jgi:hypothetical protein
MIYEDIKHKLKAVDLELLGFKKNDLEEISVYDLYVFRLPSGWEIEVSYILGEGNLFPPNCEDFGKGVPLYFKSFEQLKYFIEAFR